MTSEYSLKDIKVLKFKEVVRKRPGMYLGNPDCRAVEHTINELVSNGIDLFLAGKLTTIEVQLQDDEITVKDDGPGLPFELTLPDGSNRVINYLINPRNTPSLDGHAPHIHLSSPGIGFAPIIAASKTCKIQSWSHDKRWQQLFEDGEPIGMPSVIKEGNGRGSTITVSLEPTLFSQITPRYSFVRGTLFESAHLFPGLRLVFGEEIYRCPNGLKDLVYIHLRENAHMETPFEPFHYHQTHEDFDIQIAVAGISEDRCLDYSWINGYRTVDNGSHVNGLKAALKQVGWKPRVTLTHAIMNDPRFAGSGRGRLVVPKLATVIKNNLIEPLSAFFQNMKT